MAKRKKAGVLSYNPDKPEAPPTLVAAGEGLIAERILEVAKENGLPIKEDPLLAQALTQLEVGVELPGELYAAIAEVLVWAWEADQRAGGHTKRKRLGLG